MNENKKILIIDDEQVILDAIEKVVSLEGFSANVFLNINEAIEYLSIHEYDLIICDIMMPEIDGFEFLTILRKMKVSTPVVITTGFSTLENAVKALYEGAVGFIPKPFTVEELTSIIKRGIEYGKIFSNKNDFRIEKNHTLLDFIPCPPKYHRLGFDSWLNIAEEGIVTIGLTDLFLKSIGMIRQIEFMNIDEAILQGGICLKITDSKDCIHQLLAPISGRIVDINEKIIVNKTLLEKDPYFLGWIYKLIPNNLQTEIENITPCSTDL